MPDDTSKVVSKSLSDDDIATFARRAGPSSGAPGTDVDAHSDAGAPMAATDADAIPASDKDS